MTDDYFKEVREGLFKAFPRVRFVEVRNDHIMIPCIAARKTVTRPIGDAERTIETKHISIGLKHAIPFGRKNMTEETGLALGSIIRTYVEPDTRIPLNFIIGFRFWVLSDDQSVLEIGWAYEEEPYDTLSRDPSCGKLSG